MTFLLLSLSFLFSCYSCPRLCCSVVSAVIVFPVQQLQLSLPFLFSCYSCLAFPVQLLQLSLPFLFSCYSCPYLSCSAVTSVLAFPVQLLQLSLPFLFSCDSCLLIKLVSLFLIACWPFHSFNEAVLAFSYIFQLSYNCCSWSCHVVQCPCPAVHDLSSSCSHVTAVLLWSCQAYNSTLKLSTFFNAGLRLLSHSHMQSDISFQICVVLGRIMFIWAGSGVQYDPPPPPISVHHQKK